MSATDPDLVPDQPVNHPEAKAPSGSSNALKVAVGLMIFGLSSFVFLGLSGRDLGPALAAPVSVAWTILNAVGIGLFMPLEQEVGRQISAARARGALRRPPLPRVTRYAVGAVLALAVVALVGIVPISDTFLGGSRGLVVVLVLALAAQALEYYARGILAGTGRFRRYSTQLAVDGGARIVLSALVFLAPAASPVLYGAVLVASPLIATLTTIPLRELLGRGQGAAASAGAGTAERTPGTAAAADGGAPAGTAGQPLAPLVVTSVSGQLLANAGPLAIAAISSAAEQATTGQFVAAVTIARIPLFLFAAVQAVYLPSLAAHVTTGRVEDFRRSVRAGALATAALGGAGVLGVAVLGRWAMQLVYGPEFDISRLDITLIALSGGLFMGAQLLVQGLLAHQVDALVAWGWGLGIAVTVATLFLPLATTTTVAVALCTGSAAALLFFAAALRRTMRGWAGAPRRHSSEER
ncbi:lipopolysaccharide biosynthesis protein [Georgenia sp. SYP-B2076]|uniref:lipopolysaccharide biosynthesis protein n=1 Tax=Georgenia sp. SYP-B2076 TaxID=2495881 RepID=UPI000F8EF6C6|nr:hypothetical protein [Georgenia sp. SYP-B2076]